MKKLRKKLALATGLSLAPIAGATALSGCSNNRYTEYHILTINDFHGAVPGYGEDVSIVDAANPGCFRLQKEINKIFYKYPDSVLLSAGDENSGDSWSTCSHGQTTYPILKAMGVRYCAVGNHAFEWGLNDMSTGLYDRLGRTDKTEGKYFVTSNIFSIPGFNEKTDWCVDETQESKFLSDFDVWNKSRVPWADPYKILKFGNARVCLIGLTTQGTIVDGNVDVTKHLSFVDYNASVNYTKHLIKQELGEEQFNAIDSFILFTHCAGEFNETKQELEGEVVRLAESITTDVDAIMSAHSHKIFCGSVKNNRTGKDIIMSQAGTAGRAFTDTKLTFDPFADPGKRLHSISMEVKKVPIPTDYEEARQEWEYFINSNDVMDELKSSYSYERDWVNQFFSRHLSKNCLADSDMQNPDKYKGYYNGIKDAIDRFTKQKTIPGHDYWAPEGILDHFGGWVMRACMLGIYYNYYNVIRSDYGVMPSCGFITQDSTPSRLAAGDIRVREIYDMVPYDNQAVISYLTIRQLGNILNYILAGTPNDDQTEGFKYHGDHYYQPDLNVYFEVKDEAIQGEPIKISSDTVPTYSQYLCGPLMWYGISAKFVEITEKEHKLTYYSTLLGEERPVFDKTAKYRVATKTFEVGGEEVILPDIKIFNYIYNSSTSKDNIEDIDKPEAPTNADSWKDAGWWYEQELQDDPVLIPVLTNKFLYTGGNKQNTMFADYEEYNRTKYGDWNYPLTSTKTTRDLLETLFVRGVDEGYEWEIERAPVNIPWSTVKKLVTIIQ